MMNGTILPFLSGTIVQITYNHGIFVHECAMQFEFDSEFDSVFDSDFDFGRIKKNEMLPKTLAGFAQNMRKHVFFLNRH